MKSATEGKDIHITKFMFCKMSSAQKSHLSFPSPALKQESGINSIYSLELPVKGNSFSAWTNTEITPVHEMPCRQVTFQGGLIHQVSAQEARVDSGNATAISQVAMPPTPPIHRTPDLLLSFLPISL